MTDRKMRHKALVQHIGKNKVFLFGVKMFWLACCPAGALALLGYLWFAAALAAPLKPLPSFGPRASNPNPALVVNGWFHKACAQSLSALPPTFRAPRRPEGLPRLLLPELFSFCCAACSTAELVAHAPQNVDAQASPGRQTKHLNANLGHLLDTLPRFCTSF